MRRFSAILLLLGWQNAGALDRPAPDFTYLPTTTMQSEVHGSINPGLLNTNDSGTGITGRIGVDYAFPFYDTTPRFNLNIDLYLGGIISDNETEFGSGNLEVGAHWLVWHAQGHRLTGGAALIYPLAQSETFANQGLGLATPDFIRYFEDAYALNPRLVYSYQLNLLSFSLYGGADVAWITDDRPPLDDFEFYGEFGGGLNYTLHEQWQLTVEASSIAPLTEDLNSSELWVGPGLIWQNADWIVRSGLRLPTIGDARDALLGQWSLELAYKL